MGERTSSLALDLALENIAPDEVHIIENVRPFSEAVQRTLAIEHDCDFVVSMDADSLILEDMGPFLQENTRPFVDSYVLDKFRGGVYAGVHITRIDVVRAMSQVKVPEDDKRYVLKPESRIRELALWRLGESRRFRRFRILHDFFQYYRDIFCKYAIRELRSRKPHNRAKLNRLMGDWGDDDLGFSVARRAVEYARTEIRPEHSSSDLVLFIAALPDTARRELEKMRAVEKAPLDACICAT